MNDRDNKKLLKAKEMSTNGQYVEAFAIIKRLHNKYPGNRLIKFELCKLNILLGEREKGVNSLRKLLCTDCGPCATIELGKIAQTEGNFTKAREYFIDALNTKTRLNAMMNLARLEIELGNIENGKIFLNQLLHTECRSYALLEMINVEIMCGNIESAMLYASKLTDENFWISKMLLLIKIFIINENYLKALECIDEIQTKDTNYKNVLRKSYFYIKNKIGMISNADEMKGYVNEQIFSYSESKAINHIKKHLFERNEKAVHSVFNSDIDINDLFKKVQEEKGNYEIFFDGCIDYYIMDLGYNIGTWKNISTTKVKVSIIHNTNNIITIFPYISEYNVSKINNKCKKLK